jgi:protease I
MRLSGKRIAILVEQDFEDAELTEPLRLLREAGADVTLVGPFAGRPFSGKKGTLVTSDVSAGAIQATDFDALIIPGGYAPDKMRMRHAMVDLVRDAVKNRRPVAAICHGPQLLISADAVRGRTLTCWPSIAIDVKNAGGLYVDRPVVWDKGIITSRKPDDIPAFVEMVIHAVERLSPAQGVR